MLTIKKITLVTILALGVFSQAIAQEKIALVGGTLIDGTGSEPLDNSVVLIDGDTIVAIGQIDDLSVPGNYRQISTEGQTVLPGLWDPHVHLLYSGHSDFGHWFSTYADQFGEVTIPASAQQFLMSGVTSVRDLAVTTNDVMMVRNKINNGELIGPTIYTAGQGLVPNNGRPAFPNVLGFDNAEDAATKTQWLIDEGADIIKAMNGNEESQDAFNAIVETAHAAGLRATVHGRSDDEIRIGLLAGADEFQHIGTTSDEYPQDILDTIKAQIDGGKTIYWSPTIGVDFHANALAEDHEWLDHPKNFVGLTPEIEADVRSGITTANYRERSQETLDLIIRKYNQLKEIGVVFIFGSDMGTFGHPAAEATWRELDTWVNVMGMPAMEAIQWATLEAASYMGVADNVGSVETGKQADIIVVEGNPLTHINVLANPVVVIKQGTQYK